MSGNKIQLHEQYLLIAADATLADMQAWGQHFLEEQRGIFWWIGDLAIKAERKFGDKYTQVFPEWASPNLIARCKAVSEAFPPSDRNILASWTQHMNVAKRGDRVAAVAAIVEAGQNSDEARKNPPPPQNETARATPEPEAGSAPQEAAATAAPEPPAESRWLLAVDMNYFIHTYFHSGAGVAAANTFVGWLVRLIIRLRDTKGLTDAVVCIDSATNFRKKLTAEWEDGYKPRSEKSDELASQLKLAPEMLRKWNIPIVSIDDMEADDVMASYAVQFKGRVTLVTADKDMRQCLSETCNILADVVWEEDPGTGEHVPRYKWISAKMHVEEGYTYSSVRVTGIPPNLWPHFQAIAGDSTDGIKGCIGIGAQGAMDLIHAHQTVQAVVAAAQDGVLNVSDKKRLAILDFAEKAETMLKLTTLRTDLEVPMITRINLTEPEQP